MFCSRFLSFFDALLSRRFAAGVEAQDCLSDEVIGRDFLFLDLSATFPFPFPIPPLTDSTGVSEGRLAYDDRLTSNSSLLSTPRMHSVLPSLPCGEGGDEQEAAVHASGEEQDGDGKGEMSTIWCCVGETGGSTMLRVKGATAAVVPFSPPSSKEARTSLISSSSE